MKYRPPTIHNQLPNTERHNIQPKHNEGTKTQLTTSTKNFISIKFHWKGDTRNKPRAIQRTNDLKKHTNHTQKSNKVAQTSGNHQISQIIRIPEESTRKTTAHDNHQKTHLNQLTGKETKETHQELYNAQMVPRNAQINYRNPTKWLKHPESTKFSKLIAPQKNLLEKLHKNNQQNTNKHYLITKL